MGGEGDAWRRRIINPEDRARCRDHWANYQAQKLALPELFEWRHRLRVTELMMKEAHPYRAHITRVLESEEQAARDDATALMRSQEITGAATMLDISWPPQNNFRIWFGRPGRELGGGEESESDSETEPLPDSPPPPYCGFRYRDPRMDGDNDGNGRPQRV